jgi:hypothetical protein
MRAIGKNSVNVFDLPAHPPIGPDGQLNLEQIQREYLWEHPTLSGTGIGFSNGNRHALKPPTSREYIEAVLANLYGF